MTNKSWPELVEEFNQTYDIEAPTRNFNKQLLQLRLVDEEITELCKAMDIFWTVGDTPLNRVEVLDAIGDSIYVLIGLAKRLGFDIDGAFREIHKSNMSKQEDGKVLRRQDGKIMKGSHYFKPYLVPYISRYEKR